MLLHPFASPANLEMGKSNHRPICLDTKYLAGVPDNRPGRTQKIEARWLAEETVEEIVKTARQKAVQQGLCPTSRDKLDSVHTDLHKWDQRVLKEPHSRLRKAQKELDDLMKMPPS